jgi:hypothetical protein
VGMSNAICVAFVWTSLVHAPSAIARPVCAVPTPQMGRVSETLPPSACQVPCSPNSPQARYSGLGLVSLRVFSPACSPRLGSLAFGCIGHRSPSCRIAQLFIVKAPTIFPNIFYKPHLFLILTKRRHIKSSDKSSAHS